MALERWGAILYDEKRFAEARPLLEAAFVASRYNSGTDDPHTWSTALWLALALEGDGDVDMALSLQREIVAARLRVLGPEDRETVRCRSQWRLAALLHAMDKDEVARAIVGTVVEPRSGLFGDDDPDGKAGAQLRAVLGISKQTA